MKTVNHNKSWSYGPGDQTLRNQRGSQRHLCRGAVGLALILGGLAFATPPALGDLGNRAACKPTRFAVISDPHFYDTRLGVSGAAFENYLMTDPKLLRESEAILDAALEEVTSERARFVIIPGDLTKDGELVNHLRVAQKLAKLEHRGVQVYVVPGNHDLNNPDAKVFIGDTTRSAVTVTPKEFQQIYGAFGYNQAISRDRASLSYVVEAVPGLWLLAIDSTDSGHNQELGSPRIGGHILPQTMTWIQSRLQEAHRRGKQVIAFMHHGVNLNFLPEAQVFPDYLVDDWPVVGAQLGAAGLKVIFTGHYHSQDAAYPVDATGTPVAGLVDVETSSLASYPCAFRMVTVDREANLEIESRRVTDIKGYRGAVPFQTYAEAFTRTRLPLLVTYQLMDQFGLPQDQAAQVAPFVVDALVAQYAGDEIPSAETQATLNYFVSQPDPLHTLGLLIWGLWMDLPPGDNELVVPLGN